MAFNDTKNTLKGDLTSNGGAGGVVDWFTNLLHNFAKEKIDNAFNQINSFFNNGLAAIQADATKQAQTLADTITQYPFIKGAQNKSALGNNIPYLIGKMYNTPLSLTDGFYTLSGTDGENQYYHGIFCLCYGKQKVTEVKLGDETILKNADGIPTQSAQTFYYQDEAKKYPNTLELVDVGETFTDSNYLQKVVVTNDGNEIKHDFGSDAEPLIRQVADNTKRLEVCIQFNGLRTIETDSTTGTNYSERSVTIRPFWSTDGGETWTEFSFQGVTDNVITRNTNHTIRFVAVKEFDASEVYGKTVLLKVVRDNPKLESNADETCYLNYYQSFCYDAESSSESALVDCAPVDDYIVNHTTRLGVTVIANANTDNYLNEFHTIAQAYGKTYNGSAWSSVKSATSNPASQILEILTSDVHTFSKYDESEIDLTSLGALYTWCDTKGIKCNALLTSGAKKIDIINNILSACSAAMYIDTSTGLLTFAIDKAETEVKGLINAENVINLNYTKDLTRRPDGLKVQYTNEESWQIDTFFSMYKGGKKGADDSVTDFNVNYITDYENAYKLAQRKLREYILQPRAFSATMGREARKYRIYDVVHLQHPTFRQGLKSTTILNTVLDANNAIIGLELSDYIQFEEGKKYGIIINAVTPYGSKLYSREITGSGKTRLVTLADTISGTITPQQFNLCSVGYLSSGGDFDTITDKMKITAIESNGSGYNLTLKDYNEAVYDVGTIPAYYSNITRPPLPSATIPDPTLKGLNGSNGYNTRTIELFCRSLATPTDFPADFTQIFKDSDCDATTAQLNGWSVTRTPIREDNAPEWSIVQNRVSQAESVVFKNTDWSTPVKCAQDVTITKAEIQEMIDESTKNSGAPFVYSEKNYFAVGVDDSGAALMPQTLSTEIHVIQSTTELEYQYVSVTGVPDGMTASHDGNTFTLSVAAGAHITAGSVTIKINYAPYLAFENFADEDGTIYGDENGDAYGYYIRSSEVTEYTLNIAFNQVKAGRYYGVITGVSEIPDTNFVGDFFTWTGADTSSSIVAGGKFLKGAVYQFNGEYWAKDTNSLHIQTALSDILADANEELEANNSEVVGLFKKIVSNSVVAANLTVTGTAFMNNLNAKLITSDLVKTSQLESGGIYDLTKYAQESELSEYAKKSEIPSTQGDKIVAKVTELYYKTQDSTQPDKPTSSTTIYDTATTDVWTTSADLAIQDGWYIYACTREIYYDNHVEFTDVYVHAKTIISGGYIRTGIIKADEIKATDGFFEDITVTGKIVATMGIAFSHNIYGYGTEASLLAKLQSNYYPDAESYTFTCIGSIKHCKTYESGFTTDIDIFSISKKGNYFYMSALVKIEYYKTPQNNQYLEGLLLIDDEGLWLDGTYVGDTYITYNLAY